MSEDSEEWSKKVLKKNPQKGRGSDFDIDNPEKVIIIVAVGVISVILLSIVANILITSVGQINISDYSLVNPTFSLILPLFI